MPWTVKNPPRVALNWTKAEKERCVAAANAVLAEGGEDGEAIQACIHAAGKGKSEATMAEKIERRFLPLEGAELRADADGRKLGGYAAVFNTPATIAGAWIEEVAPGAYSKTISEHDIRALWNHDPGVVLGRNKASTLRLWEDSHGLNAEIEPPDNEWGRPVLQAVKRGDVTGMSIAFRAIKQEWVHPPEGSRELPRRTIREVKLYEVSPVTFPAFESTTIGVRAEDMGMEAAEEDVIERARVLVCCAQRGLKLTNDDLKLIAVARDLLAGVLPTAEPGRADARTHSDAAQDGEPEPGVPSRHHSADWRIRELTLLGLTVN